MICAYVVAACAEPPENDAAAEPTATDAAPEPTDPSTEPPEPDPEPTDPEPTDGTDTPDDPKPTPPTPKPHPHGCVPGNVLFDVQPDSGCRFDIPTLGAVAHAWPLSVSAPQSGPTEVLPLVQKPAECYGPGWFIVGEEAPAHIQLCPASCFVLSPGKIRLSWACGALPDDDWTTALADLGPDPWGTDVEPPEPTDASDDPYEHDECQTGAIHGIVCSPTKQTFVSGVTVSLTATGCSGEITLSTKSDELGFYFIDDVPEGLWTVTVTGLGLSTQYPLYVNGGATTDATKLGKKECFQTLAPDECYDGDVSYSIKKTSKSKVVDIIWAVDTSGSMKEEADAVAANLSSFATFMGEQSLDYHVILIGANTICVPEPLGGPGCTDGENFKHVVTKVNSKDALEKMISEYPKYEDFLRPGGRTHFVVVTDDNSNKPADWFDGQVIPKTGFSLPYTFHSIVGMGDDPFGGCSTAAQEGDVYLELSATTGGATYPICDADWSSVFDALATLVVESFCSYPVFAAYPALSNAAEITMSHTDFQGETTGIQQVESAFVCNGEVGFFIADDPPRATLCPVTCDGLSDGSLSLEWICDKP